jgi:hypothetical protein
MFVYCLIPVAEVPGYGMACLTALLGQECPRYTINLGAGVAGGGYEGLYFHPLFLARVAFDP